MLDFQSVLVIGCALVVEAVGDLCPRMYLSPDGSRDTHETFHKCSYGCCHKYEDPCCSAPFVTPSSILSDSYTGTAFVVTLVCAFIVPAVMGVTLCFVLRARRRQQQRARHERREERRRERRMRREQERIFFTSGEFGPQVLGPPGHDIPTGNPISPPEYSEIAESPTSPLPPPPPYTRTSNTSSDTESDDDGDKSVPNNSPSV